MTADTMRAAARPKQPSMRRLIVAATIGNVLEWFDFVVYGFFAVTIAEVFFPVRQPDRVAADHVRRVRPGLFRAAVGSDHRRRLYRPRRAQSRPYAVDRADDDRHDADGGDAGLCHDRHRRADHHHARAAAAGVFGRRRIRQRGQLPRRAWRRAARVQRQLAICHRRHHHGPRLAVRGRPDDAADPPAAGRLGMAAYPISSGC